MTTDPLVAWFLRLALAGVFAAAALHKASGVEAQRRFRSALADYRVLPLRAVGLASRAVPAAEATTAGLLVAVPGGAGGPMLALGLLAAYSGAIALNLARGRRAIDCGCGGPTRQPIAAWMLVRNAGLAGASVVLFVAPHSGREPAWIDVLSLAGALAFTALTWNAMHALAALAHDARLVDRRTAPPAFARPGARTRRLGSLEGSS